MTAIVLLAALHACGSEDYEVRVAASKIITLAVRKDPPRYGAVVEAGAGESSSAEVRARCGRAIGPLYRWRRDTFNPSAWPRLDASDLAGEEISPWLLQAYREQYPCMAPMNFWWCDSFGSVQELACEMYVRHQLLSGRFGFEEAEAFLARARATELKRWFHQQRLRHGQ